MLWQSGCLLKISGMLSGIASGMLSGFVFCIVSVCPLHLSVLMDIFNRTISEFNRTRILSSCPRPACNSLLNESILSGVCPACCRYLRVWIVQVVMNSATAKMKMYFMAVSLLLFYFRNIKYSFLEQLRLFGFVTVKFAPRLVYSRFLCFHRFITL